MTTEHPTFIAAGIRVRRASDNKEMDIKTTQSGFIDEQELSKFLNGDGGYVVGKLSGYEAGKKDSAP